MGDLTDLGARLREARDKLGITQAEFAELVGVERKTQGSYEAGKTLPKRQYFAALAQIGVDVPYVLTGQKLGVEDRPIDRPFIRTALLPAVAVPAPQFPDARSGDGSAEVSGAKLPVWEVGEVRPLTLHLSEEAGQIKREYQVIPRILATARAGEWRGRRVGTDQVAADMAGVIAMERNFMRAELGRDGQGFVTVRVEGDSMERTLADGETIIIDTLVDRVTANGIYVLGVGDDLIVKRVVRKLDGSLVVKSDNPVYSDSDELFTEEASHRIKVIGRMVWPRVR